MLSKSHDGEGRRIGELASASGMTVRMLRHYEEIGLLVASIRTDAGHRLYTDEDVERLYRISLLRQVGLPLADIAKALDDPEWDVRAALATHLGDVERQLAVAGRIRTRLVRLTTIDDTHGDHLTEELLDLLEEMKEMGTTVQSRISILVYADLEAMFDELTDVFSLGPGQLTRDGEGRVVHGELHAGDGVIWLHPESSEFGLKSPRSLGAATATTAVIVEDVDAHFSHAAGRGAAIVYEPVDQPYGYREYGARDSEGALWSFMKPINA